MSGILEVKASFNADDAGTVTGLAWPWGIPDRMGDMIEKGAFSGASLPLPMLFAHNPTDPVGSWTDVEETAEGLVVKGKLLIETVGRAREIPSLMTAGAIGGLSIGFFNRKSTGTRGVKRTITALDLTEISLVTTPMHPGARVRDVKTAPTARELAAAINRAAVALSLRK